ncbi:hypothetical protein [Methylococcus capsulatus]|uniref:hypothetical protein n=1 Tax=Methylococcus capsulatus TaxID=414 RepID=UPI001C52FB40|nr:hypothetical protein [Methylococcus capsulatus]QXP86416.1 hypothetical protein KW112_08240 [Methylococcus capsulatus]QXP93915.1 hypothetical protein KW113_01400 [Methylococcus capsulatus]UQN11359.1 hypothetical protein M3M30_09980 [Methylococcus capsulatus]
MNRIRPFPPSIAFRKAWLAGFLLLAASPVRAGLTAGQLIDQVGISQADVARLQKGEIVSYSVVETGSKSLATGIAMYLKTAPARIVEVVRRGELAARDPDVTARGVVPSGAGVEAFAKFAYGRAQVDEARDLLNVRPGSGFNLSAEEIAGFAALKASLASDDDETVVEAVSRQYRSVLAARLRAYRSKGLAGMAAYERGDGDKADPAAELTDAIRASKLLGDRFPGLQKALLGYPAEMPAGAEDSFIWLNRMVQGRPTPILVHRIIHAGNDGALLLQSAFYVGHSYDVSQTLAGTVPYLDGALVFYSVRSSTDQVTGLGEALKHSIGRGQMEKEMIEKFRVLKASVKG